MRPHGRRVKLTALTARQRDVVALVALGKTRREIAERLQIREGTVKYHLKAIARELPGTGNHLRRLRLHAREILDHDRAGHVPRETSPAGVRA